MIHETELQDAKATATALAGRFGLAHCDEHCIAACEAALRSPLSTYIFFARYAAINGYAGPLVARLASTIGLSRGIFVDRAYATDVCDRDMQVAAKVFAATIDEYGDVRQSNHPHRTLAQVTVEAAAQYAGLDSALREKLGEMPTGYQPVVDAFIADYQGEVGNARALIRSLGYHLASELRADREYALIDEVFRHREKGRLFHDWLRDNRRIPFNGENLPTWYWIASHGYYGGEGVEWAHFDAAVEAVRQARKYSPVTNEEFNQLLDDGIQAFLDTINQLFQAVASECHTVFEDTEVKADKSAGIMLSARDEVSPALKSAHDEVYI